MACMAILIIFLCGISNFGLHKAVLESGHRLLGQLRGTLGGLGGRATLLCEFLVLLAAMLLAANGWPALAWAYLVYSAVNGVSAWLILSGRI